MAVIEDETMATTNHPNKAKILLAEQSKDELIEEILKLRRENETLKKENEDLKKQIKPEFVRVTVYQKKKHWKKLGRPIGHPGVTRPKPEIIDHIVEQTLERCPECGQATLEELPSELEDHIQEDIVPAKVEATKFIRHGYWCRNCKKGQKAPYAPHEVPYGYLGPNVLAQTVLLKYFHGLPYSKISHLFRQLCSLKVSDSGLAQALQRLGRWLKVEQEVILEAIHKSPWVHGDETGWKIAGIGHWFWNFVNEKWALYQIRQGRGRKEAREVMGSEYQGVMISDFLTAYDKTGRKRQRCWVHLLREIKRIRDPSFEEKKAARTLKRIFLDARRLNHERGRLAPWVFARRVGLLKDRLLDFAAQPFESKTWRRLSERILKYHKEFFTFLEAPGIPSDNNHAERMIRPNVIFRKISFQNMSRKGADAHEVLMSLVQSLRLQNRTPFAFIRTAYLKHRQGNPTPIFSC